MGAVDEVALPGMEVPICMPFRMVEGLLEGEQMDVAIHL